MSKWRFFRLWFMKILQLEKQSWLENFSKTGKVRRRWKKFQVKLIQSLKVLSKSVLTTKEVKNPLSCTPYKNSMHLVNKLSDKRVSCSYFQGRMLSVKKQGRNGRRIKKSKKWDEKLDYIINFQWLYTMIREKIEWD